MTMLQLNDLLPQSESEFYWTLYGNEHEGLADDQVYVIFEHYCINPACDCEQLTAEVMTTDEADKGSTEPLAVIDYDWSSQKTSCLPTLHESSPKTKMARHILAMYKTVVHDDEYLTRIKGHYARIRVLAAEKERSKQAGAKINQKNLVGRNEPCPCDSGKKYKKCCLSSS